MKNKAYHCFCTPEELEAHRNYMASQSLPIKYSGKCAGLDKKETEEKLDPGQRALSDSRCLLKNRLLI